MQVIAQIVGATGAERFVGYLSFMVGIVGFTITLWQLRRTRHAAEAAKIAADGVRRDSQRVVSRYLVDESRRMMRELTDQMVDCQWEQAFLRMEDVAERLAELSSIDADLIRLGSDMRGFRHWIQNKRPQKLPRSMQSQWRELALRITEKLERMTGLLQDLEGANDGTQ